MKGATLEFPNLHCSAVRSPYRLSTAALLAASPAIAQTTNPDAPAAKPAPQTAPMPRVKENRDGAKAKMPDGVHKSDYRASKIIGATVVNVFTDPR